MSQHPQKLELTWYNKDQALIPTEGGRYGYTWVAPQDPRYCETHTLIDTGIIRGTQKPKVEGTSYTERADLTPTEDNLLILGESGDVLEALTRVPELADKYVGKVKCVYIDPPFNTAQTFANYEDNLEHSIWLTMMRDRLINLRALLSDNGTIWIHLDDVESHRMRVLLDEVFGANNFLSEMHWERTKTARGDSAGINAVTDEIVVYRKSNSAKVNRLPKDIDATDRYANPDNDPNGPWQSVSPLAPGNSSHPGMVYGIQHPFTGEMVYPSSTTHWRFGAEKMLSYMNGWARYELCPPNPDSAIKRAQMLGVDPDDELIQKTPDMVVKDFGSATIKAATEILSEGPWPVIFTSPRRTALRYKTYASNVSLPTPKNLLHMNEVGGNATAKNEIKALFPGINPFSTPKPERLLERIIHIATDPGDIVLDIFAGSGTTAAVAQKMGRRWVTCELVEDTVERFTRPRLEKVVNGEDMGGISISSGGRVDSATDGLPDGISPDDAQKFTSLLNKIVKDKPDLRNSDDIKKLKEVTKTKNIKDAINWRGGGVFTVAKLAPSCFDYDSDLDIVTLTAEATGQTLVNSVAANLGFYLTPDDRYFDGALGRQHLAVVEGVLDEDKVNDLMAHLPQGNTLLLAATIVNEGVREYVRSFKNGSRVINIPLDIFTYTQKQEEK